MKPFVFKTNTYITFELESLWLCKNIEMQIFFAKGYTLKRSEKIFMIKKVKIVVQRTRVIEEYNDEEIVGTFYEKQLQKTN